MARPASVPRFRFARPSAASFSRCARRFSRGPSRSSGADLGVDALVSSSTVPPALASSSTICVSRPSRCADVGADQGARVVDRPAVPGVDAARLILQQAPQRAESAPGRRRPTARSRRCRRSPAVAAEQDARAACRGARRGRRVPRRVEHPERAVARRDGLAVRERRPGDACFASSTNGNFANVASGQRFASASTPSMWS